MPSWYAFKLIDSDPPREITFAHIFKSMKKFEKEFNVEYQPIEHPSLLVWDLMLEEKKVAKRHTRSSADKEAAKTQSPVIKKYIFAFNSREEILFVNKFFTKKLQGPLMKALHCQDFDQLDLSHGTPSNLLMLYSQSNEVNPGALELQYQEKMFDIVEQLVTGLPLTNEIKMPSNEHRDLSLQIGSFPEKIPEIKKVHVDIRNVPITTKIPNLQGYRFLEMAVEVSSPSVLHLYKNLAEEGIIKDVPPWLKKMRARGSHHCNAHFN